LAALSFWTLNRILDCLDGAFARRWEKSTELGGFLDLLGDFTVYSLIPVFVVLGRGKVEEHGWEWMAVAVLEASFHLNNFILFYVAAVAAKVGEADAGRKQASLTSVVMHPALVEGFEAGAFFTLMIVFPGWVTPVSWIMSAAVGVGIIQRVMWVAPVLGQLDLVQRKEAK
jgi:phosphatidylglycerophosphate synthase